MILKRIILTLIGLSSLVLLVFFIAFLELNIVAFSLENNSKIIGVLNEQNVIVSSLKENNKTPKIIISDSETIVYSIAAAMSGEGNLYAEYILPFIPRSFVLPLKQENHMVLMDNVLFIINPSMDELESISSIIGYYQLQQYFSERKIKSYPKVTVMDKADYLSYRKKSIAERIKEYESEVQKIDKIIAEIYKNKQKNVAMIAQNKKIITEAITLKETKYKTCCSAIRKRLDKEIKQGNINVYDWNIVLNSNIKQAARYESLKNTINNNKKLLEKKEESLPNELGVFTPEKDITIALFDPENGLRMKSDNGMYYHYFQTLLHEYLHYASYISKDKKLTSFFDEGLTEYFAQKVFEQNWHTNNHLGYPIHVVIITEMTKKIPEKELEDIYFSKDEKKLERVVDTAYGKDFYKSNVIFFQTLHYTADIQEGLKIANEIMGKIGGKPITKEKL